VGKESDAEGEKPTQGKRDDLIVRGGKKIVPPGRLGKIQGF